MASITLDVSDDLLDELNAVAVESGGLGKYFEKALGLAKLVEEETKKNNLIAIADKDGKILRTVRTARAK